MANANYTKVNIEQLTNLAEILTKTNNLLNTKLESYQSKLSSIESSSYMEGVSIQAINTGIDAIQKVNSTFSEYSVNAINAIKKIISETQEIDQSEADNSQDVISADPLTFGAGATAGAAGVAEAVSAKSEEPSTKPVDTKTSIISSEVATKLDAKLGSGFSAKVEELAKELGCNPNDLLGLFYSESGFNTSRVTNGYVGLIQLSRGGASELGYTTDQISQMTATEQLNVVKAYYKKYNYYDNKLDAGNLYAITFLPGRANRNPLTVKGENYYNWNKGLDINKDGAITKEDLASRINNKYNEMVRSI